MTTTCNHGAALILAVMMLSLLSILGGALLTSTTIDIWIGDNYKTRTQALYLAEAGVEQAREELLQSASPLSVLLANASGVDGVLATADDRPLFSAVFAEGNYTIRLRNDVVDDFLSTTDTNGVVTIVSIGRARGSVSTVEATIRERPVSGRPFLVSTSTFGTRSAIKRRRGGGTAGCCDHAQCGSSCETGAGFISRVGQCRWSSRLSGCCGRRRLYARQWNRLRLLASPRQSDDGERLLVDGIHRQLSVKASSNGRRAFKVTSAGGLFAARTRARNASPNPRHPAGRPHRRLRRLAPLGRRGDR